MEPMKWRCRPKGSWVSRYHTARATSASTYITLGMPRCSLDPNLMRLCEMPLEIVWPSV